MANMLLVGGAGFTGFHILQAWLAKRHNRVTVLDKGASTVGMARLRSWMDDERVTVVNDDARDRARVDELLRTDNFDCVVQLCAGTYPSANQLSRREVLDTMARGTQYLVEGLAEYSPQTPLYQLVSTAPWGDDYQREVRHGNSLRPCSLMGVAESIAIEVALGLGRELGIRRQIFVAPLAFGAYQTEGPLPEFLDAVLSGKGYTQSSESAGWRLIYAPDLAARVLDGIQRPQAGDVIRLPGLDGGGWGSLTHTVAQLLYRFSNANPALKERFPKADWRWRAGIEETRHPGWPEVVIGGSGAIEMPETTWPVALAETLRWYLQHPELWQEKVRQIDRGDGLYAPAM